MSRFKTVQAACRLVVVFLTQVFFVASAKADIPSIDARIVSSSDFSVSIPKDPWDKDAPPPFDIDLFGPTCNWADSRPYDAQNHATRAWNLAASQYFEEAIAEWSKAIELADDDSFYARQFLVNRSALYYKIGSKDKAIADAEEAASLKNGNAHAKFIVAVQFIRLGKLERALEILNSARDISSKQSAVFLYLQGVLMNELKDSESSAPKVDVLAKLEEAARQFAASGEDAAAQACLDYLNQHCLEKTKTPYSLSKLGRPDSNFAEIAKLFRELATNGNAFDSSLFEDYTQSNQTLLLTGIVRSNLKEILSIQRKQVLGAGDWLKVYVDPRLCSIDKSKLESEAQLNAPQFVKDSEISKLQLIESFKVPSGLLVITSYKGSFRSIYSVELYSKGFAYSPALSEPDLLGSGLTVIDDSDSPLDRRDFVRDHSVSAARLVDTTLKDHPTDCMANAFIAESYFRKGDYERALACIDIAIANQPQKKPSTNGNKLLVRRAAYLVKLRKFELAYDALRSGLSANLSPSDYLLRAQCEMGLRLNEQAKADLVESVKGFDRNNQIALRDEANKLLGRLEKVPLSKFIYHSVPDFTDEYEKKIYSALKSVLVSEANLDKGNKSRIYDKLLYAHYAALYGLSDVAKNHLYESIELYRQSLPAENSASTMYFIKQYSVLIDPSQAKEISEKLSTWTEPCGAKEKYRLERQYGRDKDPVRSYTMQPSAKILLAFDTAEKLIKEEKEILVQMERRNFALALSLIAKHDESMKQLPVTLEMIFSERIALAGALARYGAERESEYLLKATLNKTEAIKNSDFELLEKTTLNFEVANKKAGDYQRIENLYDYLQKRLPVYGKKAKEMALNYGVKLAGLELEHARNCKKPSLAQHLTLRAERQFDYCIARCPTTSNVDRIKLQKRVLLNCPLLTSLDLFDATVTYKEDLPPENGNRMGAIVDGLRLSIVSAEDIGIIGSNGGYLSILIGGKTFSQIAIARLEEGKIAEAEDLVIQALRAFPKAETFELLSETCFLQGKYELAYEAASTAVFLDSNSIQSLSIMALSSRYITHDRPKSSAKTAVFRTYLEDNPSRQDLKSIYVLLAADDKAGAIATLKNLVLSLPNNNRAKALMQIVEASNK